MLIEALVSKYNGLHFSPSARREDWVGLGETFCFWIDALIAVPDNLVVNGSDIYCLCLH